MLARNPDEAVAAAKPHLAAGNAVVLKILSPDIVHKSEVGGVRLGLITEHDVRQAAADILSRARAAKPDARINGVTVFPMIVRPKARELIVGMADDPTFGPVIVFGQGGTAVEVIDDKALALPPLDLTLARDLIARTRVSRILKAYRNVPAADERRHRAPPGQAGATRRGFSRDPRDRSQSGSGRRDRRHRRRARVSVAPAEPRRRRCRQPRFAIRPYPKEWERHLLLPDGTPLLCGRSGRKTSRCIRRSSPP